MLGARPPRVLWDVPRGPRRQLEHRLVGLDSAKRLTSLGRSPVVRSSGGAPDGTGEAPVLPGSQIGDRRSFQLPASNFSLSAPSFALRLAPVGTRFAAIATRLAPIGTGLAAVATRRARTGTGLAGIGSCLARAGTGLAAVGTCLAQIGTGSGAERKTRSGVRTMG